MPILRFEMAAFRNLSFLVFVLCVLISLKNQNAETKKGSFGISSFSSSPTKPASIFSDLLSKRAVLLSTEDEEVVNRKMLTVSGSGSLEYDFYRKSCPAAEKIIRDAVRELCKSRARLGPALVRLVFHDCFIEGCDGSVLLDGVEGMRSEKDSLPNESLKGFDAIDIIKSKLEEMCPGVVSCADILVLAAREAVVLAGGPFYPLKTGRRDSTVAYSDMATYELPSPHADVSETLASFASRGFDERETVSLLGSHSTGITHCRFFKNRLYNFDGSGQPDPTLDSGFLNLLRSKCDNTLPSRSAPSASFTGSTLPFNTSLLSAAAEAPSIDRLSSSPEEEEEVMDMTYGEPAAEFGTVYYRHLLQGKGLLFADQQLMAGEETRIWVRAYASDPFLFRRDFALVMMRLSNLRVLTAPRGQIRHNCSKMA
ncbi:hypothetical protein SLE2022_383000 [Rubroshorea leprosula]